MRNTLAVLVLLSLPLVACDASPTAVGPAPEIAPEAPVAAKTAAPKAPSKSQFGAAITDMAMTPLTEIVNEPDRFTDKTVRTEGLVTGVCQAKGCWMEIGDEAGTAHIKFAGYAFFVPRSASGHRAIVQGKIVPTADECASKDGCREAGEKASGQVAKVDFEATGVELLD